MSAQTLVWSAAAAALSGLSVAALVTVLVPPTGPLGPRIGEYIQHARARLGSATSFTSNGAWATKRFGSAVGPMFDRLAGALGHLVDVASDEAMMRKLTQAGLASGLDRVEELAEYRMRQLRAATLGSSAGIAAGMAVSGSVRLVLLLAALGLVIGGTRGRGRLERRIDERRQGMRVEIYTVNQMLALHVRVGGGVVRALQLVVERGSGEVIRELREVLRLHRAGASIADALQRWVAVTPEPHCARTYSLLAVADERGADLAKGLLQLSEDVRESRREAIRRNATKRRALMLIPTIAILAPVLLLFVAAPLPQIIFGVD